MYKKREYNSAQTDRQTDDCSVISRIFQIFLQSKNALRLPFTSYRLPAKRTAFSLAEIMVAMLLVTIILAATMPILSKRAKVKQASAGAGSGSTIACMKVVTSSLPATNPSLGFALTSAIPSLSYQMYGGGGGASFKSGSTWYGGGGGGSSAILINGVRQAYAQGGEGGRYSINMYGKDGYAAYGTLSNLTSGQKLTVYAGGGGGAGFSSGGGGGGSGYYGGGGGGYGSTIGPAGGGTGSTYGAGGTGTSGNGSSGASLQGGDSYGGLGKGGIGNNSGTGNYSNGGGYGWYGGSSHSPSSNGGFNTGKGGTGDTYTYDAKGGDGGIVILFYTTTASSCFL